MILQWERWASLVLLSPKTTWKSRRLSSSKGVWKALHIGFGEGVVYYSDLSILQYHTIQGGTYADNA